MPGDKISWQEYQARLNAAIDNAIAHGATGSRQEIGHGIDICGPVEEPPNPEHDFMLDFGL
jgi:hypothetical protein